MINRTFRIALVSLLSAGLAVASAAQTAPKKTTTAAKPAPTAKTAPAKAGEAKKALTTEKEKVSYALGMNLGLNLNRVDAAPDIDDALVLQGLKDGLAGSKTQMDEGEMRAVLTKFQNELRARSEAKYKAEAAKNKTESDAFLAKNKAEPGVVVLPSGLQYKVLTAGTGAKPTTTDTVEVNYRGTLIGGKEFDASAKHGGPATFPVGAVIKGWTEALQLMPVGSKWQLVVPSQLAYGERGSGPDIGPNATLIFEVELLSIKPAAAPAAPAAPATPAAPSK